MKTCKDCQQSLPLDSFTTNAKRRDGRASYCRPCRNARARLIRASRPESEKKILAKRSWAARNKDKVRAASRRWKQQNPEHNQAIVLKWQRANPAKNRAKASAGRARKRMAAGYAYTKAAHIEARVELYGRKCFYCGTAATSVDHRIPLARGGSHWPANLVPACKSCNSRKHTRTQTEFQGTYRP